MPTDVQYQFCSFQESLISKVLSSEPPDHTVFIFPTESNKRSAEKEFQASWQFTPTRFLTMAEFQEMLFLPEKPLLKEEKRTLAFYASLSADDKNYFRINNYFQAVELAQNAFKLWEELIDECVDENLIDEDHFRMCGTELFDWQKKTWERLVAIREQYRKFIAERGFDDKIFAFRAQSMVLDAIAKYQRFVFVNQFYYTQLEKHIIKNLTLQGRQVVVWYQLPQEWVDTRALDAKPIKLKELRQSPLAPLRIYETRNDFTMLIALIDAVQDQGIQQIVDVSPRQAPLLQFLEWQKFDLPRTLRFHSTTPYRFVKTLQTLLDGLFFEPSRQKLMLPLQLLLDAVLCREFLYHFLSPDQSEAATLNALSQMIDWDYKYLDLDGEALQFLAKTIQDTPIRQIIEFLSRAAQIRNISDLITWLEAADGLRISHFIAQPEREVTHLLETLYRFLSDFQSIEKLRLVTDWHDYFPSGENERSVKVAAGLLRLFLDYLRTRPIRLDFETPNAGRIELTDLIETRNIPYDRVAIWNAVEGALPASPQPPFLFTENQRKCLHLKSYDEVKEREKYYFYRLILNAKNIHIFTQRNIEQNVDVSSFVEELRLAFPDQVHYHKIEADYYRSTFRSILNNDPSPGIDANRLNEASFYRLALDSPRDFPEQRMELTPYSFKDLQNPFYFYLRHIAGIREFAVKSEPDLSAKMIGNLAHDLLNLTWEQLDQSHAGGIRGYDFLHVEKELNRALDLLFRDPQLPYRMPLNYAGIYFREITLPALCDGIMGFFKFLTKKNLHRKKIQAIPEKTEKIPKTWLFEADNALGVEVRIKGRADLRIEVPDEQRYYIFDYKTGGYDVSQLLLYKLYYYLIESPELTEKLEAYFYNVLSDDSCDVWNNKSQNSKKITRGQLLQNLRQDLLNTLEKIAREGFSLPTQKQHLEGFSEITRKDLFLRWNSKQRNRQVYGL